MGACYQCPRECGVDRERGVGFCGVGEKFLVAKTMLHRWEEPCICGDGGAGTIFFSGCNLRCVYCQNCDISRGGLGNAMTEDELAREIFSLIEQGATNLSGGQRQRLTIARALVGSPRILVLDDSSSALDFATDARLRIALREHLKDTTVFIVSQRTSSIMHADKIIVLDDGKISATGTHEELLGSSPLYREIHESQFGKGEMANG